MSSTCNERPKTPETTSVNKRKSLQIYEEVKPIPVLLKSPKTLVHLILDLFLENWCENPIYEELSEQKDRQYILENLNVNLPLKILITRIHDDFFWRRCYQHRWRTLYHEIYTYRPYPPIPPPPATLTNPMPQKKWQQQTKSWINIYMERHLAEMIENLMTSEYEEEMLQASLDICAGYINQLEIKHLQASRDGQGDHIPLDFILCNLPELHTLRLTYCTKTIGKNFYLGCNTLSRRDANLLARGLGQCHELIHFCLHNTVLKPYQLGLFAHSLDKGCHHLTTLSLEHCNLGDEGIQEFLKVCNKESFGALKYLDLTNNKISSEGSYVLSRVIKSIPLEKLSIRLNPIGNDGAAAIFGIVTDMPLKNLDISGCFLTDSITKLFMQIIIQNKTLWYIDLSNNDLGEDFGKHLYKVIGFNKQLKALDLRNTGITLDVRNKFKQILKENFRNT